MREDQTTQPGQPDPNVEQHQRRFTTYGLIALAALIVFLAGFVPMWMRADSLSRQRDAARHEHRVLELQLALANAAIDIRRGEYEQARLSTAAFFQGLNEELTRPDSKLEEVNRAELDQMVAQRDDIITLLARSDPASAERLTDLYFAFRKLTAGVTSTNPPG
jgi:hypothetical protein